MLLLLAALLAAEPGELLRTAMDPGLGEPNPAQRRLAAGLAGHLGDAVAARAFAAGDALALAAAASSSDDWDLRDALFSQALAAAQGPEQRRAVLEAALSRGAAEAVAKSLDPVVLAESPFLAWRLLAAAGQADQELAAAAFETAAGEALGERLAAELVSARHDERLALAPARWLAVLDRSAGNQPLEARVVLLAARGEVTEARTAAEKIDDAAAYAGARLHLAWRLHEQGHDALADASLAGLVLTPELLVALAEELEPLARAGLPAVARQVVRALDELPERLGQARRRAAIGTAAPEEVERLEGALSRGVALLALGREVESALRWARLLTNPRRRGEDLAGLMTCAPGALADALVDAREPDAVLLRAAALARAGRGEAAERLLVDLPTDGLPALAGHALACPLLAHRLPALAERLPGPERRRYLLAAAEALILAERLPATAWTDKGTATTFL